MNTKREKLSKFIRTLVNQSKEESLKTGRDVKEIMLEKLRYITSLSKLGVSSSMVENAAIRAAKELLEEIAMSSPAE